MVFRSLSGIPFGAIWEFTAASPHFHVDFRHILLGSSLYAAQHEHTLSALQVILLLRPSPTAAALATVAETGFFVSMCPGSCIRFLLRATC